MGDPAFDAAVRDAVREALGDLLPQLLASAAPSAPAPGGLAPGAHAAVPVNAPPTAPPPAAAPRAVAPAQPPVPVVPAPPVAAVHRPSAHPVLAPVERRASATPVAGRPAPAAPDLGWSAPARPQPAAPGVPQVPGPPIAAVHRPGGGSVPMGSAPHDATDLLARGPAPAPAREVAPARRGRTGAVGGRVEEVAIGSDADLDAFVRQLLRLFENPRDRMLVKSGKLRFTLRGAGRASAGGAVHHVEKGAVTERQVREAAAAGARIVLGRRAVLTPMARDRARAMGVVVEKEA